jgi:hypothetical protein
MLHLNSRPLDEQSWRYGYAFPLGFVFKQDFRSADVQSMSPDARRQSELRGFQLKMSPPFECSKSRNGCEVRVSLL